MKTLYGLGPNGERRCLEPDVLALYEPEHDYASGAVIMRDKTRLADSSIKAQSMGWADIAREMQVKGL